LRLLRIIFCVSCVTNNLAQQPENERQPLTVQLIDWSQVDTVLLDMDGTLIDLHFDNTLWNSHLPEVYAQANKITTDEARERLFSHMRANVGTIEFYCLDYWAEFTALDILQLHRDVAGLLRYRQGTEAFLRWLQTHPSHVMLATNAHRDSVKIKDDHLKLLDYFDTVVSSHDYQQVKESQEFWHTLTTTHAINPQRALFIDDNEAVLDAAAEFGIAHVLCVASPDSQRPPRTESSHPMIHNLYDLVQEA